MPESETPLMSQLERSFKFILSHQHIMPMEKEVDNVDNILFGISSAFQQAETTIFQVGSK